MTLQNLKQVALICVFTVVSNMIARETRKSEHRIIEIDHKIQLTELEERFNIKINELEIKINELNKHKKKWF